MKVNFFLIAVALFAQSSFTQDITAEEAAATLEKRAYAGVSNAGSGAGANWIESQQSKDQITVPLCFDDITEVDPTVEIVVGYPKCNSSAINFVDAHFRSNTNRVTIPYTAYTEDTDSLVIGRPQCLAYTDELFRDYTFQGRYSQDMFTFEGVEKGTCVLAVDQGQPFYYTQSNIPKAFIGFGQLSGTCDVPSVIDQLRLQSKISRKVISFRAPLHETTCNGEEGQLDPSSASVTFGGYEVPSEENFAVKLPVLNPLYTNGNTWAVKLESINYNGNPIARLGCDGYLNFDWTSQYHVVPVPVFYNLLNVIGIKGTDVTIQGNLLIVDQVFDSATCASFPDITYVSSFASSPIVLTSTQYTLPVQVPTYIAADFDLADNGAIYRKSIQQKKRDVRRNAGKCNCHPADDLDDDCDCIEHVKYQCRIAFAGTNALLPYGSAFTLGRALMIGQTVGFDSVNQQISVYNLYPSEEIEN